MGWPRTSADSNQDMRLRGYGLCCASAATLCQGGMGIALCFGEPPVAPSGRREALGHDVRGAASLAARGTLRNRSRDGPRRPARAVGIAPPGAAHDLAPPGVTVRSWSSLGAFPAPNERWAGANLTLWCLLHSCQRRVNGDLIRRARPAARASIGPASSTRPNAQSAEGDTIVSGKRIRIQRGGSWLSMSSARWLA